MKKFDLVE